VLNSFVAYRGDTVGKVSDGSDPFHLAPNRKAQLPNRPDPLIWRWAGAVRQPSPRRKPKVGFPALHRPGLSQVCPLSASSHGLP
jgi:hypothetical protein